MAKQAQNSKHSKLDVDDFRHRILSWYDKHRRQMPWRAVAGDKPDPYHVWMSEVMLQQTVVAAVIPYFQKFVDKWPKVKDLAEASEDDVLSAWAGLGYYSRARNLHKCAKIIVSEYGGEFPADQKTLKSLPGIGDYTSAAIRSIAFGRPATVVDGNVERVMARFYAVSEPLPASKKRLVELAHELSEEREDRPGDFAQALMDLGSSICIPKAARCVLCPVQDLCEGRKLGIANDLPLKTPKKPKPQKYGYVYWIADGDNVLLEKRPEKGMLASMTGFPTSEWVEEESELKHLPFCKQGAILKSVEVHHSFTHFDLSLRGVQVDGEAIGDAYPDRYFLVSVDVLDAYGFPTLFKKFLRLMVQNRH